LFFATKIDTLKEALFYVEEKNNGDYSIIIMLQGSLTVPGIK